MIPSSKTLIFTKHEITYDGTQLAGHWIYRQFDLAGDAIVAFCGPADVSIDHMVDLADVKKKAPIGSPQMLHFVAEWFQDSLDIAILLQHLFTGVVYELLWEKMGRDLRKRGNDLYYRDRKLSVSIATRTTVSTLMHTGINIRTKGTPIPTSGLSEMGIDPVGFAGEVLERFSAESETWRAARCKVLPRV